MSNYMTQNRYVDTSIQKGGIEGFSGCLEHTGVLSQLIQEAKKKKDNLIVVWLDFANVYRSIPGNLTEVAMDHYHIPHHIQGMITNDLGDIKLRFQSAIYNKVATSGERNSNRVLHLPHLVVMGMNLIISTAIIKSRELKTAVGSQRPAIRAFTDDLTVITPTHMQARWVLAELECMATWAKMIFISSSPCPQLWRSLRSADFP